MFFIRRARCINKAYIEKPKTRSVIQAGFFYFALKNLVLWARSEIDGSALEFFVKNHKIQAPNYK
jgi:hypothetical protein